MHVLGSSGSGKSRFLEWMIRGDFKNRQGSVWSIRTANSMIRSSRTPPLRSQRRDFLLNLSEPDTVCLVSTLFDQSKVWMFHPSRSSHHRHMHAWGVENADETADACPDAEAHLHGS